jgi:hypothetical protein
MTDHDYGDQIGWLLLYLVVFTVFVNLCKALICLPWKKLYVKISQKWMMRSKKYMMKDPSPVPEEADGFER